MNDNFLCFLQSVTEYSRLDYVLLVALILSTAIFTAAVSGKYVNILQQSSYKVKGLRKWLAHGGKEHKADEAVTFFLAFAACCLAYFCLLFARSSVGFLCVLPFLITVPLYLRRYYSEKQKKKLVATSRVKRLYAVLFILSVAIMFFFAFCFRTIVFFLAGTGYRGCEAVLCPLFPVFTDKTVMLAEIILSPFENYRNARFVKRAKEKLKSLNGVIKIGITGSYGKTSVKNILYTILSERYKVLKTPESYNTPLGIAKTVENLDSSYDVFIAEMGARKRGDIKELCEIVPIDYAILTGVAEQHIETFGDINEILNEKTQILRALRSGVAVVNSDCAQTATVDEGSVGEGVKLVKAGVNRIFNPSVTCENVCVSASGSEFTLVIDGKKATTRTKLLGEHFITDILLAAGIAYSLGMSVGEIAAAICKIEKVKHRTELIDCGSYFVIDDGYNSNPAGAKEALKTLALFNGPRILVTPGIIEAGSKEKTINFAFGLEAARSCDYVILVNSPVVAYVKEGVLSGGMNKENLFVVEDIDEAKTTIPTILRSGGVVLFENDLPDAYL